MPVLTVALIADPEDPFGSIASEEEWGRPYSQRRTTRVEAENSATLASVLRRATADLGLVPPDGGWFFPKTAFYRPEDDGGFGRRSRPRYLLGSFPVVDRRGLLKADVHDLRTVTIGQLVRSAEAGVLDGDPLRPYLIIESGYGDAPGFDWPSLQVALESLRSVVQIVSEVGGTLAFGKFMLDAAKARAKRGAEVVEENIDEWSLRIDRPEQLLWLLESRSWTSAELGPLLGVPVEDAAALMSALGFAPREEDGQWVAGGDEPGEVIRDFVRELDLVYRRKIGEDLAEILRPRLERLLRDGVAPPYDDLDDDDDPVPWGVGRTRRQTVPMPEWALHTAWLRVLARRSRRPNLSILTAALAQDGARVEVVEADSDAAWARAEIDVDDDRVLLHADLDDGDPEGLFAAEIDELSDDIAFARTDERRHTQALLGDCRLIVAIAGGPSHSGGRVAERLAVALSVLCDGFVHRENSGISPQIGDVPPAAE